MDNKDKDVWKLLPWIIHIHILNRLSTKDLHEVESICKDWQFIIKSTRFYMLQMNTNPNQDSIIMHAFDNGRKCQFQPLDSNELIFPH